jgi:hypothetical protein
VRSLVNNTLHRGRAPALAVSMLRQDDCREPCWWFYLFVDAYRAIEGVVVFIGARVGAYLADSEPQWLESIFTQQLVVRAKVRLCVQTSAG